MCYCRRHNRPCRWNGGLPGQIRTRRRRCDHFGYLLLVLRFRNHGYAPVLAESCLGIQRYRTPRCRIFGSRIGSSRSKRITRIRNLRARCARSWRQHYPRRRSRKDSPLGSLRHCRRTNARWKLLVDRQPVHGYSRQHHRSGLFPRIPRYAQWKRGRSGNTPPYGRRYLW